MKNAEAAALRAVSLSDQAAHVLLLADIQEDIEGKHENAYANFPKALSSPLTEAQRAMALGGLTRTTRRLGRRTDALKWFKELEKTSFVDDWDYDAHADYLYEIKEYAAAAAIYENLARKQDQSTLRSAAELWRRASVRRWMADELDLALRDARQAIAAAATITDDTTQDRAIAHAVIAAILNDRGVYEQAADAARQSIAADGERAWAYVELARALNRLERSTEAETAAKSALNLSDGKNQRAHFELGTAYFNQKKWSLAATAYANAARLDPADSAAAYNVAVSYCNDRFYSDAITWYEETLRRDPNRKDRAQILALIQELRRR